LGTLRGESADVKDVIKDQAGLSEKKG